MLKQPKPRYGPAIPFLIDTLTALKILLAHLTEGSCGAYSMVLEPASVRASVRPSVHIFKDLLL